MTRPWYVVDRVESIASPALLVYPDRVRENIARMIAVAGGTARLRPHVKTHKLPQVVRMQLDAGITKFKAATIAEVEMTAAAGAPDVLFAYPAVGPNIARLIDLVQRFPTTTFSALADNESAVHVLSSAAAAARVTLNLFLDVDAGMHRSGIEPGAAAVHIYRLCSTLPGLHAAGLHVYDGHLHQLDLAERTAACEAAFAPVAKFRRDLVAAGLPVPAVVAGGTPTFPIHAERPDVDCSPGTSLFWDWGYTQKLPDMDFLPAALLLTRVVSKPGGNRVCLDLGHKAVASENPQPRVYLYGLEDANAIGHSEEHLVIETSHAARLQIGEAIYGMPYHVCPTVALHSEAVVIVNGQASDRWPIVARARRITA